MKALRNTIKLFGLLFAVSACQPDDVDTIGDQLGGGKTSVNSWVYETMNDGYFWYKDMPDRKLLDSTLSPDLYFEKLVYKRQVYDRFSAITDDLESLQQQFNGVVKAYGVNYVPAYVDQEQQQIALFVSHVIKGSPAEAAGLKRGDIIAKIDGANLNKENYATALGTKESVQVNLATVENNALVLQSKTISMNRQIITEDPVAFSSILRYGSKVVGYVVYTQFVPGTDAQKERYDNELRSIFGQFKAAGVNELILDLRLNGGGYMTSAVTLASLIVSNVSPSKVFYREQWNDKYNAYWKREKGPEALDYKFVRESNNIGARLNRVYVLTSQGTASASELVVNGLRPYMSVVTVGDHTAGKNLFGTLIGDEKKRWKHGIYIMLGQTTNAEGKSDYGTADGIRPSVQVADNRFPFLPFGDENETLLNAALGEIGVLSTRPARVANHPDWAPATLVSRRDTPHELDQRMLREGTLPEMTDK